MSDFLLRVILAKRQEVFHNGPMFEHDAPTSQSPQDTWIAEAAQQLDQDTHQIHEYHDKLLQVDLSGLGENELKALYAEIKQLQVQYMQHIENARNLHGFGTFSSLYPTWEAEKHIIDTLVFTVLDQLPLGSLSAYELDDYVRILAELSGKKLKRNDKTGGWRTDGYYVYGEGKKYAQIPQWLKLRDRVINNEAATLQADEEEVVQRAEDEIMKLHVQVRPEEWKAALKAVAGGVTSEMSWKILPPDPAKRNLPSMVFYAHGHDKQSAIQHLQAIMQEVGVLLSTADVTLHSDTVPRFSTPVIDQNNEALPGFYYVVGDGDWKEYLQRQGKLDQVYDPAMNHATRIGEDIPFHI